MSRPGLSRGRGCVGAGGAPRLLRRAPQAARGPHVARPVPLCPALCSRCLRPFLRTRRCGSARGARGSAAGGGARGAPRGRARIAAHRPRAGPAAAAVPSPRTPRGTLKAAGLGGELRDRQQAARSPGVFRTPRVVLRACPGCRYFSAIRGLGIFAFKSNIRLIIKLSLQAASSKRIRTFSLKSMMKKMNISCL